MHRKMEPRSLQGWSPCDGTVSPGSQGEHVIALLNQQPTGCTGGRGTELDPGLSENVLVGNTQLWPQPRSRPAANFKEFNVFNGNRV